MVKVKELKLAVELLKIAVPKERVPSLILTVAFAAEPVPLSVTLSAVTVTVLVKLPLVRTTDKSEITVAEPESQLAFGG
jgi:hypothetical protein